MATQQSSQEGPSEPIDLGLSTIFDYEELQEATNFFNPSEVIGRGGFGVVYRGTLSDGRAVAIKELTVYHEKRIQQFSNEVRLLSRLDHENLIRLYGCTNPEDEKMLLVYELMPNGSLAGHLHDRRFSKKALTWSKRLQIAIQTAEALTYLHSLQPAIIHRDIKPDNILLDDNFNAKVADFGSCRLLSPSGAYVSTMPQGTQAYLDPEYNQLHKVTPKSDVYSFGVVLMELISGKAVVDYEGRDGDEVWLVNMAINKINNHLLEQLFDPVLGHLEDTNVFYMARSVAQLAYECLQNAGHMRPPMMDVLKSLKEINGGVYIVIFYHQEIQEAKKFYKLSKGVGLCDFGEVSRGKLRDGRAVVLKELNLSKHKNDFDQLLEEVTLIYGLNHKNLVTLYGRTNLENDKMFLVHEFMPNGNFADHLYRGRSSNTVLTWSQRLHVAIETAEALAYLHSLRPPIIHRNVKTDNILLDDSFNVKVVDFGLCNLLSLPWDRDAQPTGHPTEKIYPFKRETWRDPVYVYPSTRVTWTDPEYGCIYRLTKKSDVYSFGIVLLELISGRPAENLSGMSWTSLLALYLMESNQLDQLVDEQLGYSEDPKVFSMVNSVAQLALECVKKEGYTRPHMINVLRSLKEIRNADTSTS